MTQLRRTIPAELGALLDSTRRLTVCDLVTLTLSGGTVYRWTSADRVVTIDGTTWTLGPGIGTGRLKWSAGVEVDSLSLTLMARADTLLNGLPLMPFINGGGLDGATVDVWRAFKAGPDDPWVGKLHRFSGKVSDIDRPNRVEAVITVRSVFELLNQQLPRNIFEAQCDRTVYDAGCALSRATYTSTATVTTAGDSLKLSFSASGLTQSAGYFVLGAVRFVTGGNAGVLRTVRGHAAGGALTLVQPTPVAVAVGDQIQIYPGCDRSKATCVDRFNNRIRFRGTPYIPAAETVL